MNRVQRPTLVTLRPARCVAAAGAIVAILSGCASGSIAVHPADRPDRPAHVAHHLIFTGSAETGNLNQWDYIEPQCRLGTSRQAVRVVTSPVRSGRYAFRFEAAGDLDPWGNESCELSKVRGPYRLGQDEYYGLSIRFQSRWSSPYRWGTVAQLAYPALTEAPLGLDARGHDVRIAIATGRVRCYSCSGRRDIEYNNWPGVPIIRPLVANRWYDLIIHVRWETNWTGLVQVWRRSGSQSRFKLVFRRIRIPTQQWLPGYVSIDGLDANGRPHLTEDKIGIYRAHNPRGQPDNVLYEDNFYVGTSWLSVRSKFTRLRS